ncbi:T7-like exonuclease [uncultured phage_MedDCM-OCT-S45-C4]|uniref:T7-like exonuclease n=1 Tax=uncultured phage_MedDCM-OCT-S45-C4 TaxID=2740801 RepID=A0A6S4P8B8_9CAUD|nr:exonuclease [uncultured phage_MedDCM-OCT-S45-C4]BAQ93989.1 T7-like exonuclease [uncultured phage_MedDCM-OCT-S45-C4]
MKLLIDADYIVYKSCAGAEDEINFGDDVILVVSKFSEALSNVQRELSKIKNNFMWDVPEMVLFFSDSVNFRKKILPSYKGHRNRKKPCGYRRVITELSKRYKVIRIPELEADDAMGIYATANPGNIIVSPDKDMRQIPGKLYNLDEVVDITPEEGYRWHLIQTMAGDQTDGYAGVPGIGIKRAVALFDEHGYTWDTVVKAFTDKDMTEEDALINARLAKILTTNEYDGQVIPWTPTDAGD